MSDIDSSATKKVSWSGIRCTRE